MLRSAGEMHGFVIGARDGDVGHVDQFFFDDEKWTIRYLIVDTGNWLSGRNVLVSPMAVTTADWENRRLCVNLTRRQVEDSPDIDTARPISRRDEIAYAGYYGWPYYWGGIDLWGTSMYPAAL